MSSYEDTRKQYKPGAVEWLLVAESPPPGAAAVGSRHFYRTDKLRLDDRLFLNTVRALYPEETKSIPETDLALNKEKWLRRLQAKGVYMIEALEESQPHGIKKPERQAKIKAALPRLVSRVAELANPNTKLLLIKSNVYEVAAEPLRQAGFNVLNKALIDYPGVYNQQAYRQKLGKQCRASGGKPRLLRTFSDNKGIIPPMKDVYIDGVPESELERSFGQKLKSFFKWLLLVILIILIAAGVFIGYNLSKLSVNPFDFGGLAETNGRTNILILGVGDPGHPGQNLSDTMMVLSLNHTTHQVAMISIPRDLRVPIPGHGSGKINSANALGGPLLAEQTVSNTLGIPINYYILTDFSGLKQAVDAVGGLDVTVKQRLYDPEYPCANDQGVCGIDIQPGNYHMDGAKVLEYTRCRKGTCGNDFGRAARQQEIITKLEEKVSQPKVYLNLSTDAALLTTLRTYAKTDMSSHNLITLGRSMKGAGNPITFVFSTAPGGLLVNGGGSDLVPSSGSFIGMQNLAQTIFTNPPVKASN